MLTYLTITKKEKLNLSTSDDNKQRKRIFFLLLYRRHKKFDEGKYFIKIFVWKWKIEHIYTTHGQGWAKTEKYR